MPGKSAAIRAGRVYVELFADNSPLVAGLKVAEGHLRRFGNNLKALGSSMTRAGIAFTVPLAYSIKWFIEFEDAMLAVRAATYATGQEYEKLTEKARELGRTTSFTATEVAQAMLELGRAGFSNAEINNSIGSMLDLARATGIGLPEATATALATLRQFKMDASQMTYVADVLVAAVNGSAASMEDFAYTLKYVGPVARRANMDFSDTAKAMGVLANLGIKGSTAGTAMRQMLLQLTNPGIQKKLKEAFNIDVLQPSGNLRKPGDVLLDIGKAMAKMPDAKRLYWMNELFKKRAVPSALGLTEQAFEELGVAIDKASGTARNQAKLMDSGVGGAWRRFRNAVLDLTLSIVKDLEPALIRVSKYLVDCSNSISKFVAENANLIVGISALSAGLLIVGPIISATGSLLLATATTCSVLAKAIALLTSPITLLAIAIGSIGGSASALGMALTTAKTEFQNFKSTVTDVLDAITNAIATGDMQLAIQAMSAGIRVELLRLQDIWSSFWDNFGVNRTGPNMGWMDWLFRPLKSSPGANDASIKRLNEITKAENELTRLQRQAKQKGIDANKAKLDKMLGDINWSVLNAWNPTDEELGLVPKAAPPEPPAWLSSAAAKIMKLDPAKILQGVGQFIGEASGAVPEFVANLAMDVAQEAGVVTQIQRYARGTFSSMAAGRMGATTGGSRTERQFDKLLRKQDHANRRLDQFVDLASKARLVFTGALPG